MARLLQVAGRLVPDFRGPVVGAQGQDSAARGPAPGASRLSAIRRCRMIRCGARRSACATSRIRSWVNSNPSPDWWSTRWRTSSSTARAASSSGRSAARCSSAKSHWRPPPRRRDEPSARLAQPRQALGDEVVHATGRSVRSPPARAGAAAAGRSPPPTNGFPSLARHTCASIAASSAGPGPAPPGAGQGHGVLAGQRGEGHADQAPVAFQFVQGLAEERCQRQILVPPVATVQDAVAGQPAARVRQQAKAHLVGPVQVLEHRDERPLGRQMMQYLDDRLEQAPGVGEPRRRRSDSDLGEEPCQFRAPDRREPRDERAVVSDPSPPQRIDPGREGQRLLGLVAPSEHDLACRGPPRSSRSPRPAGSCRCPPRRAGR